MLALAGQDTGILVIMLMILLVLHIFLIMMLLLMVLNEGKMKNRGLVSSITGHGTEGVGTIPALAVQHLVCFQNTDRWYFITVVVVGHFVEGHKVQTCQDSMVQGEVIIELLP